MATFISITVSVFVTHLTGFRTVLSQRVPNFPCNDSSEACAQTAGMKTVSVSLVQSRKHQWKSKAKANVRATVSSSLEKDHVDIGEAVIAAETEAAGAFSMLAAAEPKVAGANDTQVFSMPAVFSQQERSEGSLPEYIQAYGEGEPCMKNYHQVLNKTKCMTIATHALKRTGSVRTWHSAGEWWDHVPGCFEGYGHWNGGEGNGNVHFGSNLHSHGKRGYRLCELNIASAPQFVQTEKENEDCPSGYTRVTSESKCKDAIVQYLQRTGHVSRWAGTGTWSDHVGGCFEGYGSWNHNPGNGNVHFGSNINSRGLRGYRICEKGQRFTAPQGKWEEVASNNAGIEKDLKVGFTYSEEKTKAYVNSVEVAASFENELEAGVLFAKATTTVTVSTAYTHTWSEEVRRASTDSVEETCKATCDWKAEAVKVVLYQWTLGVHDNHKHKALTTKTCHFKCLYQLPHQPVPEPQCPLNCCANTECQTCLSGCVIYGVR